MFSVKFSSAKWWVVFLWSMNSLAQVAIYHDGGQIINLVAAILTAIAGGMWCFVHEDKS